MIRIEKVLIKANWTDAGRRFAQNNGYSEAGAMDWLSFNLVNALLGNHLNSPAIEVFGGQFGFAVLNDIWICISGAPAQICVNKQPIDINTPVKLTTGDVVEILNLHKGLINYIGFGNEVKIPLFKGSVCAVRREQSGGPTSNGIGLKEGDTFDFISSNKKLSQVRFNFKQINRHFSPFMLQKLASLFDKEKSLTCTFSYQADSFNNIEKYRFLAGNYYLTKYADNMGARLQGPPIRAQSNLLCSQPISNGAIQVTGSGQAIIMRNERQTIGGYPIIATLSKLSLAALSQAQVNTTIRFTNVSFEDSAFEYNIIQDQLNILAELN